MFLKGDIVGLSSLNSPFYWASAVVIEPIEAYFINSKNVKTVLKSNNKICRIIINSLALRLRHYEIRQKHLSLFPARERTIDALLLTAFKFGENSEQEMQVSICTSRKELAEFGNTSVEQTIRTLGALKKEEYISVHGKTIVIHKPMELISLLKNYSN